MADFSWRREPKWAQVEHDVAVNDVRLALTQACVKQPQFTLAEWIPQSEFWGHPDAVVYTDHAGKQQKRHVRPDGYGVIVLEEKRFRFLVELDRATEDNPRFVREKVYPGIAYLRSEVYKRRFGFNAGRFLIITTGERRARNMKRQAEQAVGKEARLFYFTTFAQVAPETILTATIWSRGGQE